jgi:competence protein ComEC
MDGVGQAARGEADPPDLRLAALAVGCWLAALGAAHVSARAGLTLAVGAGLAAGVLAGIAARAGGAVSGRPWPRIPRLTTMERLGWIGASALLGVVCGASATAARVSVREAEPLATLVRERVTVTADLVVRDDPRPAAATAGGAPIVVVRAILTRLRDPQGVGIRVRVPVLVLGSDPAWRPLLPGQRVTVTGRLMPPRAGDLLAAVLSTAREPVLRGEPPWFQRAAGALRAGLQRACAPLPPEPGGLLPGLVVGDTSRLDPAVGEDFRATGMTHLVAVSGSNITLVVGAVLLLARWSRCGPWTAAIVSGAALVGFVILARPSPSVVRAAAMGAIGLLALASGRPRAALPALAAAVTVLVVVDPELARDPGFALSVLATAGILLLAPKWRDAARRRGCPAGLAEALAVPAAAQLACAPVIAGLSGTVSLVAVPANLVAAPAVAPATLLGVGAALVSPWWSAGAEAAAWLGALPAWWLVLVARYGADLPGGTVPWPAGVLGGLLLAACALAVLVSTRWRLVRRLVAVVAVAVAVGAMPIRVLAPGWPPDGWVVVACDVGQGDAVVLSVAPGAAVVVDTGPSPAPVDRCLRRLAVRAVPLVVVSHFHLDHAGGIEGVLRGRRVGAVVTTGYPEPAAGREVVERAATRSRVPVVAVRAGWAYRRGDLDLTVLAPVDELSGTRSDPNNNSLVVRARVRGVDILLLGDAEVEQQRTLLERYGSDGVRADVVKVAHHGSAYHEPRLFDAVRPRAALISVGADNGFGHPHPSVLTRLARVGARVLRTDVHGDVAAVRDRDGLAVVVRGHDPGRRR